MQSKDEQIKELKEEVDRLKEIIEGTDESKKDGRLCTLKCGVCLDIKKATEVFILIPIFSYSSFKFAVNTPCGHCFCKTCNASLKGNRDSKCPKCRAKVQRQTDIFVWSQLLQLHIFHHSHYFFRASIFVFILTDKRSLKQEYEASIFPSISFNFWNFTQRCLLFLSSFNCQINHKNYLRSGISPMRAIRVILFCKSILKFTENKLRGNEIRQLSAEGIYYHSDIRFR